MPLAQRKGISAKSTQKHQLRRQEALENGIILEKATKPKVAKDARRQRSIGGPSVGRFQGGTLKLSKRDLYDIEGPKKSARQKKR